MDDVAVVERGEALADVAEVLEGEAVGRPHWVQDHGVQHVSEERFFVQAD